MEKLPSRSSNLIEKDSSSGASTPLLEVRDLSVFYQGRTVVKEISLSFPSQKITALIGPSGSGKSTFLKCLNRMNDLEKEIEIKGQILFDGRDINASGMRGRELRSQVGMIFHRPHTFPLSIYENVLFGLRLHRVKDKKELEDRARQALVETDLWEDVHHRLSAPAHSLSEEKQQRLCLARALAMDPRVLLLDEPCSLLDPQATARMEDVLDRLREKLTVVLVTHNMQQAGRISDYTAFLCEKELVEFGPTSQVFTNPQQRATEDYIGGRLG